MKKTLIIIVFSLIIITMEARLSDNDFQKLTKLSTHEVEQAVNYLNRLELEGDESWEIYRHILPELINRNNLKIGCEIGVAMGSHCQRILQTTSLEKLYGIDPYQNYGDPTNASMSPPWFDMYYYKVMDKLSEFGSRFELIRDFSVSAAQKFSDHSLDFVFIDGNHTYDFVNADLHAWWNKIRSGGFMCGDDYNTGHDGVPRAVNQFCEARSLEVELNSNQSRFWLIKKP